MTALVLGARGAIGAAIADTLAADGFEVLRAGREGELAVTIEDPSALDALPSLDAVVWAQGLNVNDTAETVGAEDLGRVLEGNVTYVAVTLQRLLAAGRIADGARLVVLSSIWEQIARPGKFSYTISKAAIGGLVRAASADLAARGILVNAVLPGVTDTPMTRAMLSPEQAATVEAQTDFGRLVALEDVAGLVAQLCSPRLTGVTGQSITVDLGFSHTRRL